MFTELNRNRLQRGVPMGFRGKDGVIVGSYWLVRDRKGDIPGEASVRAFNLRTGELSEPHHLMWNFTYLFDPLPGTQLSIYRAKTESTIKIWAPSNVFIIRQSEFIKSL